jgi:hypothetical protein
MKRMTFLTVLVLGTTLVMAHPHFEKKVTALLPSDVEASVAYETLPANETHTNQAKIGSIIIPRRAAFILSGDINAGSVSLTAGDYTIGVIKNSADNWGMVLLSGRLSRGDTPDLSNPIKLDSHYSTTKEGSAHLRIDIVPGHGDFEGKPVLSIAFGSMILEAALS